ncbi:MAG: hypothetical protein C0403_09710 [Desulfobacterium sp.]|nr:hypothetical protein [Desulfobacterium sp.]
MTPLQIEFPSRVTIAMKTDKVDSLSGKSESSIYFDFIWGIGLNGLTDFEMALLKKKQGEDVPFTIHPETVHGVFEHLAPQVLSFCRSNAEIYVTASIQKIELASNREVVKAMAGLKESGCGCGGEGGCGCH